MKETIEKRISIRSYEKKPLSIEDQAFIRDTLSRFQDQLGPFGHNVRFFFVNNVHDSTKKYGTYGFIKNPPAFIGGVVKNTTKGMIDFGFLMEQIILKITAYNLGTVWLGGTYHRKDFDIDKKDDEIIAAVTPVGYSTSKSLRERMIRGVSKGDKRMPFDELFSLVDNAKKIDDNNKYYPYLKAIQLAPSASNKQPWRVMIENDTFHMYLKRTHNYGTRLSFDIQAIDIGIALSHLYVTLLEDGYKPSFIDKNPNLSTNLEYILSVMI